MGQFIAYLSFFISGMAVGGLAAMGIYSDRLHRKHAYNAQIDLWEGTFPPCGTCGKPWDDRRHH